jgi:hypothetical protein
MISSTSGACIVVLNQQRDQCTQLNACDADRDKPHEAENRSELHRCGKPKTCTLVENGRVVVKLVQPDEASDGAIA